MSSVGVIVKLVNASESVILSNLSNRAGVEVNYAICFGLIFTFIVAVIEYNRIFLSKKKLENLDFFLATLALFNGLGYAFVFWGTGQGLNTFIWTARIESYDPASISIYFALNILLSAAVITGWSIAYRLTKKTQDDRHLYSEKNIYSGINKLAWFLLFTAVAAYILYSKAYGGFGGLLKYSKLIRSGILTVYNPFSFLQRFGAFSFFSSFLFFSMIMDKNSYRDKGKVGITGFTLSFLFSLFVLYSWEGRIAFIVFLLSFVLAVVLYRYASIIRLMRIFLIIFILGLLLIIAVDRLLKRSPGDLSVTSLFVKELSFPSAAFISQFKSNSYRWFKDILIAPAYLLPSRIWRNMLGLDTASMQVTYEFWGAYKGEAGITGSIPVDLLTFSYMQAHIAGVVLTGLLTGAVLFGLQRLQDNIPVKGVRAVISSNIILNFIILLVPYGEPYHIISRCFYLIGGLVLLEIIFRKYRVKA